MNTTENITKVAVVRQSRNPAFRSVSDVVSGVVLDEPETGFPESITDSSRYESVQSIEARCMRGEIMLNREPFYEYTDGEITEEMLDGTPEQNLDEGDLTENIDQRAELLHDQLSDLSTGSQPASDQTEKSEPAPVPVDKSGESIIAAGD